MLKLFAKFIFPQKALILNDSITFVIEQEWCVCQTLRSRLIKTWFPVSSGAYYRKKWASFLSLSPNDKNINVRIPFFFVCLCGETWGRDYTSPNVCKVWMTYACWRFILIFYWITDVLFKEDSTCELHWRHQKEMKKTVNQPNNDTE